MPAAAPDTTSSGGSALGARGEALAARYVERMGYQIIERNLRLGRYELDLVALDGDTIVFIEVRTRTDDDPVPPEDSVGPTKRRHLATAARHYIARHPLQNAYYRFDVMAILLPETGEAQIRHYKDAFQAG